jgi:peptidyl-dipeptidase A
MGHSSFFALEVSEYGMTPREMMDLMDEVLAGIMPLYRQLHCWVRHELAARWEEPVPRKLPAHWIGNRWAQAWPGVVEGIDLDALVADRTPGWLVRQAERYYTSMGFPPLPAGFWTSSDLYALPPDSERKKNTHASAWHIDLDRDVRSLMSVEPTYDWLQTTHHELGHVYYYLMYSNPDVPFVLRTGANRAFHEGVGTLIELVSSQTSYLRMIDLLAEDQQIDRIQWLLNQALLGPVTFLPFACGTMTHWEHDFYEEPLPPDQLNARWWRYVGEFQGVAPPAPRGEQWCDPATKTHISDDPAQYYDYALSSVILHQLHDYICRDILHEAPQTATYYERPEVGAYLMEILRPGATRDWRELMVDATGEHLSSRAMLEYYQPLREWLEDQNAGRDVTFD